MKLVLPKWQTIELEGTPQECALFVSALPSKVLSPEKGDDPPADAWTPQPPPPPSVRTYENRVREASTVSVKGTPPSNRRQMVLDVLAMLAAKGQHLLSLKTILEECEKTYPGAEMKNLDQVVRDLANKTDWVISPQRGRYQLAPKN